MSMAPNLTSHHFTRAEALASVLAERVAGQLRDGIAARGAAVLAVSGGTTPAPLFAALAKQALDWARVTVTLVDERWVPDTDPRSNAKLVRETLFTGAAGAARFVPLYTGAATPEAGLAEATARIAALPSPFDVVLLGMGEDGHTASFFPGGDHLAEALDPQTAAKVLPMRAAHAGEPRITLTLPVLLATRALYLLIRGAKKRDLIADVRLGLDAAKTCPVNAVVHQEQVPVAVYWAP